MEQKLKGVVTEALPNLQFLVQFDDKIRRCYLAGKLHKNFIRVLIGDKVEAVIPSQGDIARIIKRF